jgi:hypothetical protein
MILLARLLELIGLFETIVTLPGPAQENVPAWSLMRQTTKVTI